MRVSFSRVSCSGIRGFFAVLVLVSMLQAKSGDLSPGGYQRMDYGPVLAETIRVSRPEGNVALKGLAVRLAYGSAVVFDSDLLRWAAGTSGGWVDISRTSYTSYKGSAPATTEGREIFVTPPRPGWALDGDFSDPRPGGLGALPGDRGRYLGYHRHGERVVVSYRVGEARILDYFETISSGLPTPTFVRTLSVAPSSRPLDTVILEETERAQPVSVRSDRVLLELAGGTLGAGLVDPPPGCELRWTPSGRLELHLPAASEARVLRLVLTEGVGTPEALDGQLESLRRKPTPDPASFLGGGPPRWPEKVVLRGALGSGPDGYVVDTIPLPLENPWNAWFRPSGFDFFDDGVRAAVSTWNGDVWIVSGLGGDLEEIRWKRFASGLFYPMGVAVVDGRIFVTERSRLTRLHDLNGNGEADFYESFNNDGPLYPMAHSLCLEVDSEGNFYFFKNGNRTPEGFPDHGGLLRVSADGKRREMFARGMRGANSLGVGPDDMILAADQEGNWVPTARIDWIRPGRFYGDRRHGAEGVPVGEFEPPVCWIPHPVDNSTGGIAFAGDARWGPLHGRWIIGSYGQSTLFALLTEKVGDRLQGGVVPFPLSFTSGLMRARINAVDGQLYLLGMRGWQTLARRDGSFSRVRYTGGPVYLPVALNVRPGEVRLTFEEPLAPEPVGDLSAYVVERWQYYYWSRYGSPEVSVADPRRHGRDPVLVASARLSRDRKTVILEIPDLKPVMQMRIGYRLAFADGREVENSVYHTIHRVSEDHPALPPAPLIVTDEELAAMEAEGPHVEREPEVAPPAGFRQGRQLFGAYCSTCHQPSEVAPDGVAPPMSASRWASGPTDPLAVIVLRGKVGRTGVMMPFDWLADEDLASILTYVRWNWHRADAVTAEQVAGLRAGTRDRERPWTEEELRLLAQTVEGDAVE